MDGLDSQDMYVYIYMYMYMYLDVDVDMHVEYMDSTPANRDSARLVWMGAMAIQSVAQHEVEERSRNL